MLYGYGKVCEGGKYYTTPIILSKYFFLGKIPSIRRILMPEMVHFQTLLIHLLVECVSFLFTRRVYGYYIP